MNLVFHTYATIYNCYYLSKMYIDLQLGVIVLLRVYQQKNVNNQVLNGNWKMLNLKGTLLRLLLYTVKLRY